MKVSKQYNGTYITITQRVTSGGKLLIANEPFIGEAVEDSYATMRNEDCSVKQQYGADTVMRQDQNGQPVMYRN